LSDTPREFPTRTANTVERAEKLKIDVDNKTETLLVIADAERDSEASDRQASSLHTGG
jgi:hypothetical protein